MITPEEGAANATIFAKDDACYAINAMDKTFMQERYNIDSDACRHAIELTDRWKTFQGEMVTDSGLGYLNVMKGQV